MSNMLFAVGGGIISLVAVVFSLLFLTVQFASTALSPRLNLFRDAPIVWHAFGLFVGVFVFATSATLRTSKREELSVVIRHGDVVFRHSIDPTEALGGLRRRGGRRAHRSRTGHT
jgi:hypothetical protein